MLCLHACPLAQLLPDRVLAQGCHFPTGAPGPCALTQPHLKAAPLSRSSYSVAVPPEPFPVYPQPSEAARPLLAPGHRQDHPSLSPGSVPAVRLPPGLRDQQQTLDSTIDSPLRAPRASPGTQPGLNPHWKRPTGPFAWDRPKLRGGRTFLGAPLSSPCPDLISLDYSGCGRAFLLLMFQFLRLR